MIRRFLHRQDGSGTITSIFAFVLVLILGGLASDIGNAWRVREILQSTAEAAAVSGAIRASEPGHGDADRMAETVAIESLSAANLVDAWHDESFEYGFMDRQTGAFFPLQLPANAVRVSLSKSHDKGSKLPAFLLSFVGFKGFDVHGTATAMIRTGDVLTCPDPLLSVQARADVSHSDVYAGVCLYAEGRVMYGGPPDWQTPQVERMIDGIMAQAMGLDKLAELAEVTHVLAGVEVPLLEPGSLPADLLESWANIDVQRLVEEAMRDTDADMEASDLDDYALIADGAFHIRCRDNQVALISSDTEIVNAFIVSDCPVKFESDVSVKASLIVSNLQSLMEWGDWGSPVDLDAILHDERVACVPGGGVRILLYADVQSVVNIASLVSEYSPLGIFLEETVTDTGEKVSDFEDIAGPLLNDLAVDINDIARDLGRAPVCLGMHTTLNGDTIVLR